ncbi:MAG: hypothetical protein JKY94_09065 [Rhodobacteraceae bacterium]|nr:hypothetical protein [Paracoccaceae bacterium]
MLKSSIYILGLAIFIQASTARSEILAMMAYESKPAEDLAALNISGTPDRREGIAFINVDPKDGNFGKWLLDIPLNPTGNSHHIFYDRDVKKAYLTSLGQPALQVMDLSSFPPQLTTVDVPNCVMGEDIMFDDQNEFWYLTCMGSANVWKGRVADDSIIAEIKLPGTYPHGIALDASIDRLLVTSTITPDLSSPDERITVIKASTLEIIGSIKTSTAESPSGAAPVEIFRVPNTEIPMFLLSSMFAGNLWALTWDDATQDFKSEMAFDFMPLEFGVVLEIYFTDHDQMVVTTASPGHVHVFDISKGVLQAELLSSTATGGGAHHVAFDLDGKYAFVQNSFLNLPGMRDGSVTVIDRNTNEVVASMDTLKNAGLNPNVIVLLPKWNLEAGH